MSRPPTSAWGRSSARAQPSWWRSCCSGRSGCSRCAGCPRTWAGEAREPEPWSHSAVLSWAGMRGVVTLAAAFVLPPEVPERSVLVLIAMVVTVGTLLVQGTTLPWLARRLRVRGPDPREDALAEATILQTAVSAGLRALEAIPEIDPDTARTAPRARGGAAPTWPGSAWAGARGRARDPERGLPEGAAAHPGCRARRAAPAAGLGHGGPARAQPGDGRARRRGVHARPRRGQRGRAPGEHAGLTGDRPGAPTCADGPLHSRRRPPGGAPTASGRERCRSTCGSA